MVKIESTDLFLNKVIHFLKYRIKYEAVYLMLHENYEDKKY